VRAKVAATPRVLRLAGIYLLLLAVFVLALTIVYALPQQSIPPHLTASVNVLGGESPFPLIRSYAYKLDNSTDALMLDTTFRQPSDSPLVAAMASTKELSPTGDTVAALAQTATGTRLSPGHYSYYWSGYQVVLRPLVILFDYSQIRALNTVALLLVSAAVLLLLGNVAGWKAVVSFVAALLVCGFFMAAWSLQYANMTYLTLFAMLAVLLALRRDSLERFDWEIFFVTGMLAAFFDLLTVPLLTLGLPLAIVLIARSKSSKSGGVQPQARYALSMSGLWALGYVASWSAKWMIGQAVLHEDVLGSAGKQVLFRASSDPGVSRAEPIFRTFFQMFPMSVSGSLEVAKPVGLLVLAILAIVAAGFFLLRRFHQELDRDAAVLLVAPLPYLWYLFASNHSVDHMVYTYRLQAIAVFAVFYIALCVLQVALHKKT
jgi:hypothetical protein